MFHHLYQVTFFWRRWHSRRLTRPRASLIAIGLIYGASFVWHKASARKITSPPFATHTVNNLTVKLMAPAGQLQKGDSNVFVDFWDRTRKHAQALYLKSDHSSANTRILFKATPR